MTGSVSSSKSAANAIDADRRLAVLAVIVGALIGALFTWVAQDAERRLVFDTWQRVDARAIASDEVVVVMIDDDSVAAKGQWPWLRYHMAQLIDRISQAKPAAIGVDVFFTDEDPLRPEAFAEVYLADELDPQTRANIIGLPSMDLVLAEIIARRDSPTVMARVAAREGGSDANLLTYDFIEGEPPEHTFRIDEVISSIPAFEDAAFSHGLVNGRPDADGVVRRVPLSVWSGSTLESGFAVELAKVKRKAEELRWDGQYLMLDDDAIPSDANGNLQFKMGPPQPYFAAIDVLEGRVAPEKLAGKVVVLGVGATGTGDIVATPHGNEVLGALVQAQAVDAILKREWLAYPAWSKGLEVAVAVVLLALLLATAVTFKYWLLLPAAGIALAAPIASLVAYSQANLLFDPARPLLVGLFAGFGLLLAVLRLALQEVVRQQIREAEQKKEEANARELQLRMVPSSARLAELGERTEIAASLRPAKSVGGDFYDAFELENDKLLFMVGDVSGKGLRAALFMAFSKTAAKGKFLSFGTQLDKAVMALNDELSGEEDEEMDLTLLVGLIDCTSGKVEMVNAGHENPVLVQKDGEVGLVALRGGPRLRSFEGFPYQVETAQLNAGDTLVMISDGATDAVNEQDIQFGFDRVIEALKAQSEASAVARVNYLEETITLFEGKADPADDLTILALRYRGEK